MKYTETVTKANIQKGKKTPEEKWIEDMIRELEMSNLSPRERADAEKALAREAFALQHSLEMKKELKTSKKEFLEFRKNTARIMLVTNFFTDEIILKETGISKAELEQIQQQIKNV